MTEFRPGRDSRFQDFCEAMRKAGYPSMTDPNPRPALDDETRQAMASISTTMRESARIADSRSPYNAAVADHLARQAERDAAFNEGVTRRPLPKMADGSFAPNRACTYARSCREEGCCVGGCMEPDDRNAAEVIAAAERPRIEAAAAQAQADTIAGLRAEVARLTQANKFWQANYERQEGFLNSTRERATSLEEEVAATQSEADEMALTHQAAISAWDARLTSEVIAWDARYSALKREANERDCHQCAVITDTRGERDDAKANARRWRRRAKRAERERDEALSARRDAYEQGCFDGANDPDRFTGGDTPRPVTRAIVYAACDAYDAAMAGGTNGEAMRSALEAAERARCAEPGPAPDPDGWVEWTGEGKPPSGQVEYRLRDGYQYALEARLLNWGVDGSDDDIIAYRPASATERAAQPEVGDTAPERPVDGDGASAGRSANLRTRDLGLGGLTGDAYGQTEPREPVPEYVAKENGVEWYRSRDGMWSTRPASWPDPALDQPSASRRIPDAPATTSGHAEPSCIAAEYPEPVLDQIGETERYMGDRG